MLSKKERKNIRYNLRKARIEKKLTQAKVAKILDVTANHYQAIELGTRLGSIQVWDTLEDLFEIPQRQLREIQKKPDIQSD